MASPQSNGSTKIGLVGAEQFIDSRETIPGPRLAGAAPVHFRKPENRPMMRTAFVRRNLAGAFAAVVLAAAPMALAQETVRPDVGNALQAAQALSQSVRHREALVQVVERDPPGRTRMRARAPGLA